MRATKITSSEFQKEYGRYSAMAKRQAVTITNHGRAELVVFAGWMTVSRCQWIH
jgi:hypothetical protein